MHSWQKEYIRQNLCSLIENIDCHALLLSNLRQTAVIGISDEDKLVTCRANQGALEQSKMLLDILATRVKGYEFLVQGLHNTKQTKALLTLIKGVQIHVPLDAFKHCGIELDQEELLSGCVLFEGKRVLLKTLFKNLSKQGQEICIKELSMTSNYTAIASDVDYVVTRNTIPTLMPGYLPRVLNIQNRLDKSIFRDFKSDVFMVENIEKYELSLLADESTLATSQGMLAQLVAFSSTQLQKLTTRFLVLEDWKHFQYINNISNAKVHWIKFESDEYLLIKSTRDISEIKKYIRVEKKELQENEHVERLLQSKTCLPNLILDSPGMGKSMLLQSIANRLKSTALQRNVIWINMPTLLECCVNSVKNLNICSELIEIIVDQITENSIGKIIQNDLLKNPENTTELFVDSLDEVGQEHHGLALKILENFAEHSSNIRLHVACRPHFTNKLENLFGVVGYSISVLRNFEQIKIFTNYWHFQHNVEITKNTASFAQDCLSKIKKLNAESKTGITGIPLQCQMMAELYAPYAVGQNYHTEAIDLCYKSIYHMYNSYIEHKLSQFNFVFSMKELVSLHVNLALCELYPNIFKDFCFNRYKHALLKIGLIELTSSDGLRFLHRTYADLFVAQFLLDLFCGKKGETTTLTTKDINLFLEDVLATKKVSRRIWYNENVYASFEFAKFQNYGIVFFLDAAIQEKMGLLKIESLSKYIAHKNLSNVENFNMLLHGCLACDASNLVKVFTVLYSRDDTMPTSLNVPDQFDYIQGQIGTSSNTFAIKSLCVLNQPHKNADILLTAAQFSNVKNLQFVCLLMSYMLNCSVADMDFYSHLTPLYLSLRRGEYSVAQYMIQQYKNKIASMNMILYNLLYRSADDDQNVVLSKLQLLKYLLEICPELLNRFDKIMGFPPLLTPRCHWWLLRYLIKKGADVTHAYRKNNVSHCVATYLTSKQYHKFVELLVTKQRHTILLTQDSQGMTSFQLALKCIQVKTETLRLLKDKCTVTFNEQCNKGCNALGYAIVGGKSLKVLKDIIKLGGKVDKANFESHTALCISLMHNNFDAFEFLLNSGVKPKRYCDWNFYGIWSHAFECEKKIRSKVCITLIKQNLFTNLVVLLKPLHGGWRDNVLLCKTPLMFSNMIDREVFEALKCSNAKKHYILSIVLSAILLLMILTSFSLYFLILWVVAVDYFGEFIPVLSGFVIGTILAILLLKYNISANYIFFSCGLGWLVLYGFFGDVFNSLTLN